MGRPLHHLWGMGPKHFWSIVEHIIKRRLAYVINVRPNGSVKSRMESLMNQLRVLIYMRLFVLVCLLLLLLLLFWPGQIVFCHRHTETEVLKSFDRALKLRLCAGSDFRLQYSMLCHTAYSSFSRDRPCDISRRVYDASIGHDIWIWQSDMDNFIGSWKALSLAEWHKSPNGRNRHSRARATRLQIETLQTESCYCQK